MNNLPFYMPVLFITTTLLAIGIFFFAANKSRNSLLLLSGWIILQGFIGMSGFYLATDGFPPRFALLILPPLLFIASLFLTKKGRAFIDSLNLRTLTLLHIVRIPVEIVLYLLFLHHAVPQLMTFEGFNPDILSGITSIIVYITCFGPETTKKKILLVWHFACLILLVNIVMRAVLSAPFSFQQMAFDQPNTAILYFPYIWLPCCVVPLVLFSHLAAIRQLLKKQ